MVDDERVGYVDGSGSVEGNLRTRCVAADLHVDGTTRNWHFVERHVDDVLARFGWHERHGEPKNKKVEKKTRKKNANLLCIPLRMDLCWDVVSLR